MPAKKTVATATAEEVKPAAKKAVKKTAAKKEAEPEKKETVKKAPAKKAAEKKTAEKKTAEKKTAVKKTAKATEEKKAPAKKAAAKKPAAKKASVKKAEPEVAKKTVKDYEDIINWKKGEAHGMDWLYIEIKAGDLLTEVEAGVDNLETVCQAILNCMLEGDHYITEPAEENKVSEALEVRYYCDNLSQDRRKYFEV